METYYEQIANKLQKQLCNLERRSMVGKVGCRITFSCSLHCLQFKTFAQPQNLITRSFSILGQRSDSVKIDSQQPGFEKELNRCFGKKVLFAGSRLVVVPL